ncbi:MAG: hypothetical protein GF315_11400 [candidate division Zixibacteria bacterium]|nr:hypothetical protein [candidate division Zixibacteria bacterium]
MNKQDTYPDDARKLFRKMGSCSRTFFFILNREFGHLKENEEKAADPLAGGIIQKGYQCGMLWGTSLAVGAESHRRYSDRNQATAAAIIATQHLMESFVNRTNSADCMDITDCTWSSKLSIAKYFITGRFLACFNLAQKWAPEAIRAAHEGLSACSSGIPAQSLSCASEVARKMGASDEERISVAGFAGGLGLSGNACGALAAAIWLNSLSWRRENGGKSGYTNPAAMKTLETFYETTDYEVLCQAVCGKRFETIADHSEFIGNGGCRELIETLVRTKS